MQRKLRKERKRIGSQRRQENEKEDKREHREKDKVKNYDSAFDSCSRLRCIYESLRLSASGSTTSLPNVFKYRPASMNHFSYVHMNMCMSMSAHVLVHAYMCVPVCVCGI